MSGNARTASGKRSSTSFAGGEASKQCKPAAFGSYRAKLVPSLPIEPSTGKGEVNPTDAAVDVEIAVTPEGVQATSMSTKMVHFKGQFAAMTEIVWDHREKSVQFVMLAKQMPVTFMLSALRQVCSCYCHSSAMLTDYQLTLVVRNGSTDRSSHIISPG